MGHPIRVHVDRVACPWLTARFVDSDAEFLLVLKSEVERVARETGAMPFDVPGLELGHIDGRCSFESIARGLEAIATGFGVRYPGDHDNLAAQFEVYDALCAWCRLQTAGQKSSAVSRAA